MLFLSDFLLMELMLLSCIARFVREFSKTIKRSFEVHYNPYTQCMEVLDNPRSIAQVVNEMKGDLAIVSSALKKLNSVAVS